MTNASRNRKSYRVTSILLSLPLIAALFVGCTTTLKFTDGTGFTPYGTEGGYKCGTIVHVDPKSRRMTPIVSLNDWDNMTPSDEPFPNVEQEYDYKHDLLSAVQIGTDTTLRAKAEVARTETVHLTINKAHRCIVTTVLVLEHIRTLDQNRRSTILRAMQDLPVRQLALLTEVLVVQDGVIDAYYTDSVDIDFALLGQIFKATRVQGDPANGNRTAYTYDAPVNVGYKSNYTAAPLIISELSKRWIYLDQDGDGLVGADPKWGSPSKELVLEAPRRSQQFDCNDGDGRVYPGQIEWFDVPNTAGNYDYDCDGEDTQELTTRGSCVSDRCGDANPGWKDEVPACGDSAKWLIDCDLKLLAGGCIMEAADRRQKCR